MPGEIKPVPSMTYYLDVLKEKQGLKSDRALCDFIGKEASYVSQLRNGRALPSDEVFLKICEGIGMSEVEMHRAFLRLAFWRADEQPGPQDIWNKIAERLAPTILLPLFVAFSLLASAHHDVRAEVRDASGVYYGYRCVWISC